MLERFKIIALAILAAIAYGIIHDQITARICVEYFNPGHPPIFGGTLNPTLLGLGWGVIATWWMGFFLGLPLSICCTVGTLPKFTARDLIRPVCVMLALLAALAALSGTAGFLAARSGHYPLDSDLNDPNIPADLRIRFATAQATHLASYAFGTLLGIGLCIWVLWKRFRLLHPRHGFPMIPRSEP
jgi:hypothetical protein